MNTMSHKTNLQLLQERLTALGVPASHYSLGRNRDERTCLVEDGDGWVVYYSERGRLESLQAFSSFAEASEHIVGLLRP